MEKKQLIMERSQEDFSRLIDVFLRADEAVGKGGEGLGEIVVELVAKAKEKNIIFDYVDIEREILEFQEFLIKNIIKNKGINGEKNIEDMHTYFCVAPLVKKGMEQIRGEAFEVIKGCFSNENLDETLE